MRNLMCFMILLALFPCGASGYTYHVDTNDSIQDSIDAASAGDSVVVHTGTYTEYIDLKAGITICSAGDGEVIIDGGSNSYTVYFSSSGASGGYNLRFGGDNRGFTIDGNDQSYSVYFSSVSNMYVRDLKIISDSLYTPMMIMGADTSAHFRDITIANQTDADVGLVVQNYQGIIRELFINHLPETGVWAFDLGANPTLRDVRIDSCDIGISAWDGQPKVDETTNDGSEISNCRIGASAYAHTYTSKIYLEGVSFEDCETGVSTSAYDSRHADVEADDCSFDTCEDGMIIDKPYNSDITGCTFENIDDTAITITNGGSVYPVTIGGSGSDANTFNIVDGVGIHVSTDADAEIIGNTFDDVDETAILVDSGNDDTTIDDCDMDGTGGCFEGINTSGSGTFATVRDCALYDYEAHVTPSPRAAVAYKATACYGTSSDNGNNSFHDNSTDLNYQNRDASPDSLYAVKNWWGENPPDASSFAGRTGYIVYEPYDTTSASRLIPTVVEDIPIPDTPMLTSIHPSPSRGTVEFSYGLPSAGRVSIEVYDLTGRLVQRVYDGERPKGNHTAIWDGVSIEGMRAPSGIYVCRFGTTEVSEALRFVLIR